MTGIVQRKDTSWGSLFTARETLWLRPVVQNLQPLLKALDAIVLSANQSYEVRVDHGTGNEFGIYISLLKGCHIKFTAYPSRRNNIKKPSVKAFDVAILWFALGIILSVWIELNWSYINNFKKLIMVVVVKKQHSVFALLRWISGYYACWKNGHQIKDDKGRGMVLWVWKQFFP